MAKKRKKIIVAGSMVWESIYTPPMAADPDHVRAAKKKASSKAQQLMNAKYSWQKLERMLAANYRKGDLVVHLTYDDIYLPKNKSECSARLKQYRANLNAVRKAKGKPLLVMFWNFEHGHGDKRWHHHCVVNATGDDIDDIRSCWPWGSDVEVEKLRVDKEKNYETLARYMCKERPDRVGQRQWSYTRGAAKPEIETFWVESDEQVHVPKGALVFESEPYSNTYGKVQYVKYLAPGGHRQRVYAKRRRSLQRS